MAAKRINNPIEPMTLGNMRANGVNLLAVPRCRLCKQPQSAAHRKTPNPDSPAMLRFREGRW
jgi:hypothetical protein